MSAALRSRRLLDAAADLFGTRGYPSVGVDDVAAAAGVSGPSVYAYFDSKYDLLRTLHVSAAERLTRARPTDVREMVLAAMSVRRSIGTLRRDRDHLQEPEKTLVATALDVLAEPARALVSRVRPDAGAGERAAITGAVLSVVTSVGTHRTALTSSAAARVLADASTRVAAVHLPRPASSRADPRGVAAVGKREALLSAAAALVDVRDASEVSMADIAEAVGLAPSSTYRYVGGKSAMLGEICLGAARRTAEGTAAILVEADDPRRALSGLVRARVADAARSPSLRVERRYRSVVEPALSRRLHLMARQDHAEWVHVLPQALSRAERAFLVDAAFTVVDDLSRTLDAAALTAVVECVVRPAEA